MENSQRRCSQCGEIIYDEHYINECGCGKIKELVTLTVNLDRFAQGLPDPQSIEALEVCQGCGDEIYPGEDVYVTPDGYILHCDWDCVVRFVDPQVMTIEEALGRG